MGIRYRHSAGFGKRIEYYIVGLMLKDGLDVYLPLVDDDAIDAVVKETGRQLRRGANQGPLQGLHLLVTPLFSQQ